MTEMIGSRAFVKSLENEGVEHVMSKVQLIWQMDMREQRIK